MQCQIRPKLSGWEHVAPGFASGAFPCLRLGPGSTMSTGDRRQWAATEPKGEDWTLQIEGVADALDQWAEDRRLDPVAVETRIRDCLALLTGKPRRAAFLSEQILLWYRLCPPATARQRTVAALRQHGAALLRQS